MASTSQNVYPQPDGVCVLEALEDVPEIYQDFFRTHPARGQKFPYAVLTSRYEMAGEIITAKLICILDHTFYVLEEQDNKLVKLCYPIDEINDVEVLHSPSDIRIKVDGVTNLGQRVTSVFGSSNANRNVFSPIFQRIRLRIDSLNEHAPSRHLERLDRWKNLQSPVMEMARHCLMPGETVVEALLQPEIHMGIFSADRAFRGPKCCTHTCILTDKELVLIREDHSFGKKAKAGSICNFIPLNKIHSLTVHQENENLLTLNVRLLDGELFDSLFETAMCDDVQSFVKRTQELIPRERIFIRDPMTVSG